MLEESPLVYREGILVFAAKIEQVAENISLADEHRLRMQKILESDRDENHKVFDP